MPGMMLRFGVVMERCIRATAARKGMSAEAVVRACIRSGMGPLSPVVPVGYVEEVAERALMSSMRPRGTQPRKEKRPASGKGRAIGVRGGRPRGDAVTGRSRRCGPGRACRPGRGA